MSRGPRPGRAPRAAATTLAGRASRRAVAAAGRARALGRATAAVCRRRGLARALPALLAVTALAGCSSEHESSRRLELMLDFFPNADHAGIYAARAYDRALRIHAPSDPSLPLKLVAAGKADLAVSYEPEVLLARAHGLPVVAVAALVRVPLTAIVSLPRARIARPADLRGKRVGTAGIGYQDAYLAAILARAGVPRASVAERNLGFGLVPALIAGRVDAVLGAYWNYEAVDLRLRGKDPRVLRMEQVGVPTYDELVVVTSERTLRSRSAQIRAFLSALARGTADLRTSGPAALLAANHDLDARLQRASLAATLPYLEPARGRPYGYMDRGEWRAFTAFMQRSGVLPPPVRADSAFSDALLDR